MSANVQCTIAAACNATRSSAPTISTPSMHPRPFAIRQGVWKELDAEKILLLYYSHQLKGKDMKYGMLLGVDAVFFLPV